MSTDADLARLLNAVKDRDDGVTSVDNAMLAAALDWPVASVSLCLQEAKERSFIWGSRSGHQPAPWFTDIEITVQGKRFLTQNGGSAK